ncbi:hypothetical protein Tco_0079492 [Tanacetum coccineum]
MLEDDGEGLGEVHLAHVVNEGVPAELTGTGTARAGETGLQHEKVPDVKKVGAGPVLSCTGAIGSDSSSN